MKNFATESDVRWNRRRETSDAEESRWRQTPAIDREAPRWGKARMAKYCRFGGAQDIGVLAGKRTVLYRGERTGGRDADSRARIWLRDFSAEDAMTAEQKCTAMGIDRLSAAAWLRVFV